MMQNGRALTKHKVTSIQTESVEKAALIRYFENLLEFTLDRSETNELGTMDGANVEISQLVGKNLFLLTYHPA